MVILLESHSYQGSKNEFEEYFHSHQEIAEGNWEFVSRNIFRAKPSRTSESSPFAKQSIVPFIIGLYVEKDKPILQSGFSELQILRVRKEKALLTSLYCYWHTCTAIHNWHLVWNIMKKLLRLNS